MEAKRTEHPYRNILLVFVPVLLAFSSLYRIISLRIDSDESQHMHIVWDWTRKIVQYRDVFDNHTPLFHILLAPLIKLVGATPYIITVGRALMLPLFVGNLIFVYLISKLIFNKNIALWLAYFAGFFLILSGVAVEFRPDNLWILIWLGSVYYLLKSKVNLSSGIVFGSLMAINSLVSLKTMAFLLPALLLAVILSAIAGRTQEKNKFNVDHADALKFIAGFAIAWLIIWAVFAAIFYRLHALNAMIYGTVLHNLVGSHYLNLWLKSGIAMLWCLAGIVSARYCERSSKAFVFFLLLVFSLLAVSVLYPVLERETRLIVSQMAIILAGGLLLQKLYEKVSLKRFTLYVSALFLVSSSAVMALPSYRNENTGYERMYSDLLKLTDDSDYVMDAKGENIFRQRPYYFAFEYFTKKRLSGSLLDKKEIIADIIRKKADVIVESDKAVFPANLTAFSDSEYVYVAPNIKVAGKRIAGRLSPGRSMEFDMELGGCYTVLSKDRNVKIQIDNSILAAGKSLFLSRGMHRIAAKSGLVVSGITLVLTKAIERGFYPVGM